MSVLRDLREGGRDELGLSQIVAQLRNVRSAHPQGRDAGHAAELPSREAVLEIVDDLVGALYPRHFGPVGLPERETDHYVERSLDVALRSLQHQTYIELALQKQHRGGSSDLLEEARDLVRRFSADLPAIRQLLDTDIQAAFDGDPSAKSVDEIIVCFPGVAAIIRHRLAHALYVLGVPILARIIGEIAHSQTGIDIHPGAQIGESFFIDHGTGVVIGETSVIGRHVRLYQAVTLGAKRFEVDQDGVLLKDYPRHPIVEDNVVIYAGATILGRITIGRGSSIGGNVWLTHSVPAGSQITQAKTREEAFEHGGGI